MKTPSFIHPRLVLHWLVWLVFALILLGYILLFQLFALNYNLAWDESDRVVVRTSLYLLAIVLFPFTNVLRHVLLRLDCTMPGDKPAERRYLSTILSCLLLIESVASFGVVMKILGDDFNTFYIFLILGALGLFLYRPKSHELALIQHALAEKRATSA